MINQGRSVPLLIRLLGSVLIFLLILYIINTLPEVYAILTAILASFLFPMLWFSVLILTINTSTNEIHLGHYVLGRKFGTPISFEKLDGIIIEEIETQTRDPETNSFSEYQAYVQIDSSKKYLLFSHPDRKRLAEKIDEVKEKLQIS